MGSDNNDMLRFHAVADKCISAARKLGMDDSKSIAVTIAGIEEKLANLPDCERLKYMACIGTYLGKLEHTIGDSEDLKKDCLDMYSPDKINPQLLQAADYILKKRFKK